MAAILRPRPSYQLEGAGCWKREGRYAGTTVRAGATTRAHFVRVPGTSDVRPAAFWGARSAWLVRFALARERDLVPRPLGPRLNNANDRPSCRVLLSSSFKENRTIFPGDHSLSLSLSQFLFHSGQSRHARSLTPSLANLQFRCQRDYA